MGNYQTKKQILDGKVAPYKGCCSNGYCSSNNMCNNGLKALLDTCDADTECQSKVCFFEENGFGIFNYNG